MTKFEQASYQPKNFDCVEFADNPEPRCSCVLLLDTSASMAGRPIGELNKALSVFRDELSGDELAARRIELAILAFGPVKLVRPFATVDTFEPAKLRADGDTPMGAAITRALDLIEERKEHYTASGVGYYRPWIFLITDGAPTDEWCHAASRIKECEAARKLSFFAVGVEGANFETLRQISVREPLKLRGLAFRELFVWLSNSLSGVSHSQPGEAVVLNNPRSPDGWATIE